MALPTHICPVNTTGNCFTLEPYNQAKDEPSVQKLIQASFQNMRHLFPYWFSQIKKHTLFTLKNDDDTMVGMIDISPNQKTALLNFIAVDSSIQHQHLGSQLLSFAEKYAKNVWKSDSMRLHTELFKDENLSFYYKNNYIPVKIYPTGYITAPSVEFVKKI